MPRHSADDHADHPTGEEPTEPGGVIRFVECQLAEILERHGVRMLPDARRELRLLRESIALERNDSHKRITRNNSRIEHMTADLFHVNRVAKGELDA